MIEDESGLTYGVPVSDFESDYSSYTLFAAVALVCFVRF